MTSCPRIYVAGGTTLIGKALIQRIEQTGAGELVGLPPDEPDVLAAAQLEDFFAEARPELVFIAAGPSGGIGANQRRPADFMLNNILVGAHLLSAAARHRVKKLLYLGSSCMYPREAPQPLRPDFLGTGPLESTSEPYALAKLAITRLCQAYRHQQVAPFITGIPANVFGPQDDFSPQTGHVIPALMRRMHAAKANGDQSLKIWGTGTPRRDFIYAPDLADACLLVMSNYDDSEPINLGSGTEHSIAETARLMAGIVGYRGRLCFDASKPDGAARKCLESSKIFALGWRPSTDFRLALEATHAWFLEQRTPSLVQEPALA